MLDAGLSTWVEGVPTMSRHPGYWLYELLVFLLDRLGGASAVNLATLTVSTMVLWRLWRLAEPVPISWRVPLLLCLALNPWYLAASTSAIDYNYALLAVIVSVEAALLERPLLPGLFGAMALWFRLGSVFPMLGAFAALFLSGPDRRSLYKTAIGATVCILLGGSLYVASWMVSGRNLSFLQAHAGPEEMWSATMWLGRVLYKPLGLLGLPATLFAAALVVLWWSDVAGLVRTTGAERRLCFAAAGVAAGVGSLYLRYPIETSYLLPALAFGLVLFGVASRGRPPVFGWVLLGLVVLGNIVVVQLAAPDRPGSATSARLDFRLAPGVLVTDVRDRIALIGCRSFSCWLGRRATSPDARS
ncbi:hypothetical protein CH341_04385 [Rhodoplanes roseus]|uniref:Glycosyltransferase RgtA/B/C/D-like domain-containing protein n=2 Tax=Rhodoplanes roseus TaxID=29409 RepID=A0A327L381_9BRAD|nr:hypothetical protein CH341_04385 [Rhodoplanes roseus]